jgi:hypothetical protein
MPQAPAVVEGRFADELNLDPAFEALDGPHEHMVSVVVGGRPGVRRDLVLVIPGADRQRVAHENPAGWRLPRCGQHVRARLVDPRRGVVDPEGPEPKAAGLAVEQAAEYARRVKASTQSQPIAPSGATSAPVWQSDRNAKSAIGGNGEGAAALRSSCAIAVLRAGALFLAALTRSRKGVG